MLGYKRDMDLNSVALIRVAALFCLSSALGFAESLVGGLG